MASDLPRHRRRARRPDIGIYVSKSEAFGLAESRSSLVSDFLASERRGRLVEFPPGNEFLDDQPLSDDPSEVQFAETIRLQTEQQLGALAHLLARVTDALEAAIADAARVQRLPRAVLIGLHSPAVYASRVPPLVRAEASRFPWRAVVQCTRREWMLERLAPWANWFGIGVDVEQANVVAPHVCKYGGQLGRLAGQDSVNGAAVVWTCAHVISPTCPSARYSVPLGRDPSLPDFALIGSDNPCWKTPPRIGTVASPSELERLATDPQHRVVREPVGLTTRRGGSIQGLLGHWGISLAGGFAHYGIFCRFPSLIVTRRRTLLDIGQFAGHRTFSAPGHSGSLVRDADTHRAVGMIVAGSGPNSFAHQASALQRYAHLLNP